MNGEELSNLTANLSEIYIDAPLVKQLKTIALKLFTNNISEIEAEQIKEIFKEREELIKSTDKDYTCCFTNFNTSWVNFAQDLCLVQPFFPQHHYELLFSNILNLDDMEVVQGAPIKSLPLNTLMVSDNNKFMSWESAMENAQFNNGVLAIYEELLIDGKIRWHKFTINEEKRFQQSHPDEWSKLAEIRSTKGNNDDGLRVTQSTILALIRVVECCTFKSGATSSYNPIEHELAYKAYGHFTCYLKLLCAEERQALMNQIVESKGRTQTFEYLWDMLLSDKMCVHWANGQICRLILDYVPGYQFKNKPLMELVTSDDFSHESKHKEYAQRCPFENIEQMIAMSLMIIEQLNLQRADKLDGYIDELLLLASDNEQLVTADKLERCCLITDVAFELFKKKQDIYWSIDHASSNLADSPTFNKQAELSLKISSLDKTAANELIYQVFINKLMATLCHNPTSHSFYAEGTDKNGKNVSHLKLNCQAYLSSIKDLKAHEVFSNIFNYLSLNEQYSFFEISISNARKLLEKYTLVTENISTIPSI